MSLGLPAAEEGRLLPGAHVDPSPADYQQLQELLQQALKREADALRKISHLHQQLETAIRSDSGSTRTDTPETYQWEQVDNLHNLSQTSLGSPQTPPPALVVTNISLRSKSQPSAPPLNTMNESHGALFEDHVSNGLSSDSHEHRDGSAADQSLGITGAHSSPVGGERHLMPTQRNLSDIRKEREKPPTNSLEHKRSTSLTRDLLLSSSAMPPSSSPASASTPSAAGLATLQESNTNTDGLGILASGGNVKDLSHSVDMTHRKSQANTLARASSIKDEKAKSSSHRSRSNSAFQMPSWLRRRRSGAANAKMTEHIKFQHPADSIEQHFEAFKRVAVIRVDPLSNYIVSQVPVPE